MVTRIPLKLCLFYLIEAYHVWKSNTDDWRQTFGKMVEHKNLVMFAIKCMCVCVYHCARVSNCIDVRSESRTGAGIKRQEMHTHTHTSNTKGKKLVSHNFRLSSFRFYICSHLMYTSSAWVCRTHAPFKLWQNENSKEQETDMKFLIRTCSP